MGHRSKHDGRTFEPLPTCGTRFPKSRKFVEASFDYRCGRDRGHSGDHEVFGYHRSSLLADRRDGKIRWPRTRPKTYVR